MILVKSVETWEVDRDYIQVLNSLEEEIRTEPLDSTSAAKMELYKELVQGKRFVVNNQEIVIGWTKDTCNALKIPLNVYEDQRKEIEACHDEIHKRRRQINDLKNKITDFQNMSFWERLIFLFKGKRRT